MSEPTPADVIGAAFARAVAEQEEDRYREQFKRAMRVLREIPNGTPDSALTDEQRAAWRDHDEALAALDRLGEDGPDRVPPAEDSAEDGA